MAITHIFSAILLLAAFILLLCCTLSLPFLKASTTSVWWLLIHNLQLVVSSSEAGVTVLQPAFRYQVDQYVTTWLSDDGVGVDFNLSFMSIVPIAAGLTFIALLLSLVTHRGRWESTGLFPFACLLPILLLICYIIWAAIWLGFWLVVAAFSLLWMAWFLGAYYRWKKFLKPKGIPWFSYGAPVIYSVHVTHSGGRVESNA
ncbi:hypothetical protein B0H13DRAFT_1882331 [Mycena leptocephala]|nr:hypothetical protein B0H13DRAFT_1882331 [Mycena leptocephala]